MSAIDLDAWFPERTASTSPSVEPLRRFSEGNRVTALIDARRTYWLVYRALRRTFRDDDFEDVPESAREALEFVWLETVDDAIQAALGDEGCADQDARVTEPAPV